MFRTKLAVKVARRQVSIFSLCHETCPLSYSLYICPTVIISFNLVPRFSLFLSRGRKREDPENEVAFPPVCCYIRGYICSSTSIAFSVCLLLCVSFSLSVQPYCHVVLCNFTSRLHKIADSRGVHNYNCSDLQCCVSFSRFFYFKFPAFFSLKNSR